MKKGRFSGKEVSNAVRFTTAGSASTWPKSGLNVASSVKLELRLYLRSRPARADCTLPPLNGSPLGTLRFWVLAATYGSNSSWRPDAPLSSSPSRWPKRGGPPDSFFRQNAHCCSSLRRWIQRRSCSPQVWLLDSLENRSCDNGIRISADHPSSSMRVAASQMGSHPPSQHEVPMPSMSNLEPDGFTWKNARPRWSW